MTRSRLVPRVDAGGEALDVALICLGAALLIVLASAWASSGCPWWRTRLGTEIECSAERDGYRRCETHEVHTCEEGR